MRYALAITVKARVVPGIDGNTDESTAKTRDHPNGRPSMSESSGSIGLVRIGNDAPQCVPEPGFARLIIGGTKIVLKRSPLLNNTFAAVRAAALASAVGHRLRS